MESASVLLKGILTSDLLCVIGVNDLDWEDYDEVVYCPSHPTQPLEEGDTRLGENPKTLNFILKTLNLKF